MLRAWPALRRVTTWQYIVIKNVLDPATVAQLNDSVDRNRELWGEPTMGGPGGCECPLPRPGLPHPLACPTLKP